MNALLLDPSKRSIEEIVIGDMSDIPALVGYETIESDLVGEAGDRIFFDEECFLRGSEGRFRIGRMVPVSGKAVIVGGGADGASLADVTISADELRALIEYL